jgi:hypothetical protein
VSRRRRSSSKWIEQEGPLDTRSAATKSLMVFTPGRPQAEQARELLWRFASRAWRRPVANEELDRLCQLVNYTVGHGESWEEGLRRAVTAILASPKFVFRLEPAAEPLIPSRTRSINSSSPHGSLISSGARCLTTNSCSSPTPANSPPISMRRCAGC